MEDKCKRLIFHIDCNSAFLSWSAIELLARGEKQDIRELPSVVGGDESRRHGIVLAKSVPAKAYNINTAETLYQARKKCPNLLVVPPNYNFYVKCSNAMLDIFRQYTPKVQKYSIDECFLDFTHMDNKYSSAYDLAFDIKERIKKELGFTVSIGISNNKLLAKMASDMKKPDAITELYPSMVKEKMWPLSVGDLFMVGRRTLEKLNSMGILTIGDLANSDVNFLKYKLKSHGELIWNYANGIEVSEVKNDNETSMKGMGNSTTTPFDIDSIDTAKLVLMSLCDNLGKRLREEDSQCKVISVHIKYSDFRGYSKQTKLAAPTNITSELCKEAMELFKKLWDGMPLRYIGINLSGLCNSSVYQLSIFDEGNLDKKKALDSVMDNIRKEFGSEAVVRCCFLDSKVKTRFKSRENSDDW